MVVWIAICVLDCFAEAPLTIVTKRDCPLRFAKASTEICDLVWLEGNPSRIITMKRFLPVFGKAVPTFLGRARRTNLIHPRRNKVGREVGHRKVSLRKRNQDHLPTKKEHQPRASQQKNPFGQSNQSGLTKFKHLYRRVKCIHGKTKLVLLCIYFKPPPFSCISIVVTALARRPFDAFLRIRRLRTSPRTTATVEMIAHPTLNLSITDMW